MENETKNFEKYGILKTKSTKRNVVWTVYNCLNMLANYRKMRSGFFMVSSYPSCLFYLALNSTTDAINIYIDRFVNSAAVNISPELCFKVTISILDKVNNFHLTKNLNNVKTFSSLILSFDQKTLKKYLNGDCLNIYCSITVEENEVNDRQNVERNKTWGLSVISSNELKQHIDVLLEGEVESTVTISVENEIYHAHRNMLCSHSPVFKAMFNHTTLESQQNHVTITDISKEIIGEILKFIYTGCISSLPISGTIELYAAADKYGIYNLKQQCSNILTLSLSEDLVLDILVLANHYSDESLKDIAMEFLINQAPSLLEDEKFLSFIAGQCEIAQSIILTLMKKTVR